jgi:radical SAM protein with 4Fe4S-binding SPASM domain
MRSFLAGDAVLKLLEHPSVYRISTDELYELDNESILFLKDCSDRGGCRGGETDFVEYCLEEGILVRDAVVAKRPPLIQSPVPSLRYLELQITERCNLRCKHCYIANQGTAELPVGLVEKALGELEVMQGLRVLITGGEPLLHSRFAEINEVLPDFFLRKVLFTNGLLITTKRARELNVHEVQVSLDGLEAAHDMLRGEGSYKAAVRAIRTCIDGGLDVSVATMVHAGNLDDFEGLHDFLRELGVREWSVDVPCATGRMAGEGSDLQVTPETGGRYLAYGFGGGLHAGAPGFACGLHLMSVSADGRASRCTFYSSEPAGRIEEGLAVCWSRISPVRLEDLGCDCRHREDCRGGCRYRAELLGDARGRDLYRCALYDIL